MSLYKLYNLRCKYCNLAFMHRLVDSFALFVGFFFPFLLSESQFSRFAFNFASLVFYFSEKVVVNDCRFGFESLINNTNHFSNSRF